MKTIEVEEDVYRFVLRQTESIGESASSILRRLLKIPTPDGSSVSGNGTAEPDLNRELAAFLQSSRLRGARTATKRFLQILGFACKQVPESFEKILMLPGGRTRVYFARSKEEIERSGRSTHPKRIPDTPYWALTNTDTPQKRDILNTTLRTLGYDSAVVSAAVEVLT
jgi:negative modulator of initiation of replication